MLERCLSDIRHADTLEAVTSTVDNYLSRQGLDAFLFYDPGRPLAQGSIRQNFDDGLVAEFDGLSVWQLDPLRLQARTSPVVWRNQDRDAGRGDAQRLIFDPLAAAGFRSLTAIPMFGPSGSCDVFAAFSRDYAQNQRRIDQLYNPLILVAYHVSEFFRRIQTAVEEPKLTSRELECLRWTRYGKTAWEVGKVIGTSERTVNFHLRNVMTKLRAHTKHQAVLEALRLGLIA